ncbi:MAG: hypothetical protein MJ078_08815, partial [Clostridia bacterium]|nr:hypothetical protein [Clostridia bacterium]
DRIVEEIEKGNIPMSRLEDALSRIDYMRDFLERNKAKSQAPVDSGFVDSTFRAVTEKGITCIRNQKGLLPLSPVKTKKILLVGSAENESKMKQVGMVKEALEKRGFTVDFQEYLLLCWQTDMDALEAKYDMIIVTLNCPFAVGCYDKCASTSWSSHLLDKNKSMFVNFSAPHFADDYFPEAQTFVNVQSGLTAFTAEETVARLCGEKPFTGTSPVKLYM